jgi:hypothetical protein
MSTDLDLAPLVKIEAKTGTEPEVMYDIEPTVITTKDGSSAVAVMEGTT